GLRLATMVICLGAANALANPKRLLKSMPSALYEVGAAVVVALSLFPQLAESVGRVRRARRLRGDRGKGVHALRSLVVPVLEDALDRSIQLAASMDARGYGRTGVLGRRERYTTGTLMVVGLMGVCIGVYATVDAQSPRYLAAPMLVAGVALAGAGFVSAGRRVERTRYRPDRWRPAELLTALSGIAVAVVIGVAAHRSPLDVYGVGPEAAWPQLAWLPLCGVLIGLLPAWLTPPPQAVVT
ncbi:MAG: CbiQ family ECF transporter T component, partial [Nocardioidaceae bacterium]